MKEEKDSSNTEGKGESYQFARSLHYIIKYLKDMTKARQEFPLKTKLPLKEADRINNSNSNSF